MFKIHLTPLLIANSDVVQPKRLGMTHLYADISPNRQFIAAAEFHQIKPGICFFDSRPTVLFYAVRSAFSYFRTAPARLEVRTEDILTALTPILPPSPFTVPSPKTVISAKELWTNEVLTLEFGKELKTTVAAHGVKLFALQ